MSETLPPRLTEQPVAISACGTYRYWLRRLLGLRVLGRLVGELKPICFVMHNPSTADATQDDPTIRRCKRFAEAWGGSELIVVNRFAFRSTDPTRIFDPDVADPVGPLNDEAILRAVEYCEAHGGIAVAAWGSPAASTRWRKRYLADRTAEIIGMLESKGRSLHALDLSKDGIPKHPLYLPANLRPIEWAP